MTNPWRPTKVQQDVIDRMRDGWRLVATWDGCSLEHRNYPSRHVSEVTLRSLFKRGIVIRKQQSGRWEWVLAS